MEDKTKSFLFGFFLLFLGFLLLSIQNMDQDLSVRAIIHRLIQEMMEQAVRDQFEGER